MSVSTDALDILENFSKIRKMAITLNGLSHMDDAHTFFMMKQTIPGSFG